MSDTPETDAFAIKFKTLCGEKYWVPVDIARKLERERDEARKELEEYRSIAENIGAVKAVSEKEKAICERNEAQEYSKATWQSLRDSQDEVLRLTFENRELNQGIDEALILGNKLADECERILGLGLHQNTTERFKAALEAWKNYNNE
jgi:phage-related minor tail protein